MPEGKVLSKEEILSVQDAGVERVAVKQWGGDVFVRALTAEERDRFEAAIFEKKGKDVSMNRVNIRARLVAMTVCNEAGVPMFSDADVALLGRKNAAAMDKLFSVAQRLSGISQEDVAEMAKNSEAVPPASSPTGSPKS